MDFDPKSDSQRTKFPLREIDASAGEIQAGKKVCDLDASRDAFIRGMRHVASSVTVVTTDGPAGRHGATVSSFCSVSADPPKVLVCLRRDSRISESVRRNGAFTVSVLPEGHQGTARAFCGEFDRLRPDRFEGIAIDEYPGLAPGIVGATTFACKLVRSQEESTHLICIGEVEHISTAGSSPLTYHNGDYHSLQRNLALAGASSQLQSAQPLHNNRGRHENRFATRFSAGQ